MREFKFRAWDKQEEKMLIGNNQYGVDEPDATYKKSSAGAFTRLWEALARFKEDDRFELMQWTGLKDKNGKDIYEGDIVKFKCLNPKISTRIGQVKWGSFDTDDCSGVECFIYGTKKDLEIGCSESLSQDIHFIEVVGNIYENPEMMKKC